MPITIGNYKYYTTEEVKQATMYSPNKVRSLFKNGDIESSKASSGAYRVKHSDLVNYLINEQEIPEDLADSIIKYRINNNKLVPRG